MEPSSNTTQASGGGTSLSAGRGASGAAPALKDLGDFELRSEIGRGGMGTVYLAFQKSLQRTVALKVLSAQISATPKAVVRFQREAQAAAKLHHTHIVPIFAQGQTDGVYYYAMEFIEGRSLGTIISELRGAHVESDTTVDLAETVLLVREEAGSGVTVEPPEVARESTRGSSVIRWGSWDDFHHIAAQMADVADALHYAHERGVIHRDIKPHNLLVGGDGRMRISDFGLARLAEQPGVTMTGEVVGSPLYMSPEQISGNPEEVDPRADIYSLGATMYEWLTLSPPYPGETRERVISRILGSEAVAPRSLNASIPLDLETICLKALERNRDRRYRSAAELRDDLRRFLTRSPILARRAGPATQFLRFVGRNQMASLGCAAALVALALTWALWSKQQTVHKQTQAAVEAKKSEDFVLDLFSMLPIEISGPVSIAKQAIPAVRDVVGSEQASALFGGPRSAEGRPLPEVGTVASLARRLADDFYRGTAPADWPGSAPEGESSAHLAEALARWEAGDQTEAIRLIDAYVQVEPRDMQALQFHAALCAHLGRFEGLLTDAERLVGLGVGEEGGYVWRAVGALLSGWDEQGLREMVQARGLGTTSEWSQAVHGLVLVQLGQAVDAMADFDEILRTSPSHLIARLGRALTYAATGRFREGLFDAGEVLRVEADNADALSIRGDCHAGVADFPAAAADYQRAMELSGRTVSLATRFLQVAVQQRRAVEAEALAPPKPTAEPASNPPDEDPSRVPLFDWLLRKSQPQRGRR